jgi:ribonuclease HI
MGKGLPSFYLGGKKISGKGSNTFSFFLCVNTNYFYEVMALNCITINTDASFHPELKVGGYAYHIRYGSVKIQGSGAFKVNPLNPLEAEMMSIANAIHVLCSIPDLPPTKLIIINSDCLNCFPKIALDSKNEVGRKTAKLLAKLVKKTATESGISRYEFRHVRAHTGAQNARSFANEWCDGEARRGMRKAVQSVLEKSEEK